MENKSLKYKEICSIGTHDKEGEKGCCRLYARCLISSDKTTVIYFLSCTIFNFVKIPYWGMIAVAMLYSYKLPHNKDVKKVLPKFKGKE